MWIKVADGSLEDVQQTYEELGELPHGTKIQFEVETLPGLAYLANIWGDEWVINKFIAEGVTITDSEAVSSDRVLCVGYVNSPPVGVILGVILAVISIAGIAYLISKIRMWVDQGGLPLPPSFTLENVVLAGAIGLALFGAVMAFRGVLK